MCWRKASRSASRSSCEAPASKARRLSMRSWVVCVASSLPSKDSTADVCCPSAACTACCATCRASVAGCRLGETSPRATVRPARAGVLTAADARRRLAGAADSTPSRGLTEAAGGTEARRCVMARYQVGHAHVRSLCCRPDRARPFSGIRSSDLSARGLVTKL